MLKLLNPTQRGIGNARIEAPFPYVTQLAIALGSGVLMGCTPAPVNAWWLGWVAIAPLWIVLTQAITQQKHIIRRASGLGLVWGIGYHGVALFWITGIHPMTWMGVPWLASLAIALFCWIFITLWGASIITVWAIGMALVLRRRIYSSHWIDRSLRILWGAALWSGVEWLWSQSPLYWSSIAYTQSPFNLVILHLGQLSGPLTVTAALVAVNGAIAEGLLHTQPRSSRTQHRLFSSLFPALLPAVVLCLLLHGIGAIRYWQPLGDRPDQALHVGIIQGNIPNTIKLYEDGWRRAIQGYTTGYETLADQGVDAVLTPETALPFLWIGANRTQTSMYHAVIEKGVPLWLGAFGGGNGYYTNSLFTILGNGETYSTYAKVRLVPLGEYIPLQRWLGRIINRLSPLDASLIPGSPDQVFNTPFGRAIAGICYESAFSQHFQHQAQAGGEFILTASNNAHYSTTMPAQHHAQDVMRAIETDRWAARATNTGYSGMVDPHGHTHWLSGINTYELHADTLYRRQTQTPYVQRGNWLTPLLLLIGMLLRAIAPTLTPRLSFPNSPSMQHPSDSDRCEAS
jgi:apolipoprotein N-acyltransferase